MENWYSKHFLTPVGSPIRALFPYLQNPEIIGFAGGNPAPDIFDVAGLREAMNSAMRSAPTMWAQYSATEGLPRLRESLTAHMKSRGLTCEPTELLVTTGSQQALDLIARVTINPGDVVIVERPTYPTALQTFVEAGATVWGIEADTDGLDVQALEARLRDAAGQHTVKALYCVPTFANPTGGTMSEERRLAILKVAKRNNFLVIEDDPYSELRFSGTVPKRMLELAQRHGLSDYAVYMSSLSKVMAPGMRIGWMVGPAELMRRCAIAKQSVDLCSSTWTQAAAAEYIGQGHLEPHIEHARQIYSERASAMIESARSLLAEKFSFISPNGGMFVWGRIDESVDVTRLLSAALEEGVVFVPGSGFYANDGDSQTIRLCFSMCTPDRIRKGVQRLARALERVAEG